MPHRGPNRHAGVALREARAQKERTYPELARGWEGQTCGAPVLRSKVRSAWSRRWRRILAYDAVEAFAASLLDSSASAGADGDTPTTQQVLCRERHAAWVAQFFRHVDVDLC